MIDISPYIDKLSRIPGWIDEVVSCRVDDERMLSGFTGLNNPSLLKWGITFEVNDMYGALFRTISYGYPLFKDYIRVE